MPATWDIFGLGVVSVDDLLYVDGFPAPDVKTRVLRRERQCGGLTGTALVAAARLGARAAYGGLLGEDPLSNFVEENFVRNGVDTSPAVRSPDARPVHSTGVIGSSGRTRNIFFEVGTRRRRRAPAPAGGDPVGPGAVRRPLRRRGPAAGGQEGIPDRPTVERFVADRSGGAGGPDGAA